MTTACIQGPAVLHHLLCHLKVVAIIKWSMEWNAGHHDSVVVCKTSKQEIARQAQLYCGVCAPGQGTSPLCTLS